MVNECRKIIDRGKYRSRICGEVTLYCYHDFVCYSCEARFDKSRYYKHLRKNHAHDQNQEQEYNATMAIVVAPDNRPPTPPPPVIPVNQAIVYAIDLSRYSSMGEDIYDGLVRKMGEKTALNYIHDAVERRRPMDLFKKLYLEGIEYRLYPVSTHEHEMRYVDYRRILVSDKDGQKLAFLIQNSIQNALLKTASALINQQVLFKNECQESKQNYEAFIAVQRMAGDLKIVLPRTDVIQILKEWTAEPDTIPVQHPFFVAVEAPKARGKYYVDSRPAVMPARTY